METKIIKVEKPVYISIDGIEFTDEGLCLKHEKAIEKKALKEKALSEINKFLLKNNSMPLIDEEMSENHVFTWYQVSNAEQLKFLEDYYEIEIRIDTFPDTICIEQYNEDNFDDVYYSTMSGCIASAKYFFKSFGYEISIEKEVVVQASSRKETMDELLKLGHTQQEAIEMIAEMEFAEDSDD